MTVFEATEPPFLFHRPFIFILLLFFCLIGLYILFRFFLPIVFDKELFLRQKLISLLPLLLSVILLSGTVTGFVFYIKDNLFLVDNYNQYKKGNCLYVEGEVDHFVPIPESRKGTESFEVSGVAFSYGADNSKWYYSRCKVDGGNVENGKHVQIWYVSKDDVNFIMRLDILSESE